jgi:hypothetical protein
MILHYYVCSCKFVHETKGESVHGDPGKNKS